MFAKGLFKTTKSDLALLRDIETFDDFYLAGGSACAIYLGHRLSFDLDFFTGKDFKEKNIVKEIQKRGKIIIEQESIGTIVGKFNETKISFFKYPYPLVFPTHKFLGINIADLKDIACMKLDAIGSRGTKRDFIDLYFICQKEKLEILLKLYKEKYKQVRDGFFHIIRSLTYFKDADSEEENVVMLKKIEWDEVKKYFEIRVREIMQPITGKK